MRISVRKINRRTLYGTSPGWEIKGKNNHVLILQRAIYGLKQAGNTWHEELNKTLLRLGCQEIISSRSIYKYQDDYYISICG